MAQINFDGLDALQLDMETIASLPESVTQDMLLAEARVVVDYQQRSLSEKGLSPHGKLAGSIKAKLGKSKDGSAFVDVAPQGTHHVNPGGTRVRNAELGFIREYGAPGRNLKPEQWMRSANEKAAKDVESAGFDVYDEFLKKNNL